jgi:UDP-glucose 4-epimerase
MNAVQGKKCVVTGGAGFVGVHLCTLLAHEGGEVVSVDTRATTAAGATSVVADIGDRDALISAFSGASYVFHLAARVSVPESIEIPAAYFETNVMGTLNVLEAARSMAVPPRVVLASSAAVYGDQTEASVHEQLTPFPKSQYAETKLVTERMAALWHALYGLETVSIRPFNIYGPGMSAEGAYASAIGIFLTKKQQGLPILITGNGEQTRDYVHVHDVAHAYLLAATSEAVGHGEVINIASGRGVTMNAVARLVGGEITYVTARPGDILHSRADITKAQTLLGFLPHISLEEGIRGLVETL